MNPRIIGALVTLLLFAHAVNSGLAASGPSLSILPHAAEKNQSDLKFTLNITGSTFPPTPQVLWNGDGRDATLGKDNTQLIVTLKSEDLSIVPDKTPIISVRDAKGLLLTIGLPVYPTCGSVLDSFTNAIGVTVSAYSNGRNTGTGNACGDTITAWHNQIKSDFGGAYECPEFVRRYYDSLVTLEFGTKKSIWRGNAVTFFSAYAEKGLVQFKNGDKDHPPLIDDILVLQKPDWVDDKGKHHPDTTGHVAIINGITGTTINVIEENWPNAGIGKLAYDPVSQTIGNRGSYTVLGWLRPVNRKPTGHFDGVDTIAGKASGWARDLDDPQTAITVHVYIDKNAGSPNASPVAVIASYNRVDVGDHGFNYVIPDVYRDGKSHSIWVWAIDSTDATGAHNVQLPGSGDTFVLNTTTSPAPTAALLMIAGTQSATDGKILNLSVPAGGATGVSVSAGASHANFPGGTIVGWSWSINGVLFSVAPSFGKAFSKGTYQVSLVVTDNNNVPSKPAIATINVLEVSSSPSFKIVYNTLSAMQGNTLSIALSADTKSATVNITSPSGGDLSLDTSPLPSLPPGGTHGFSVSLGVHTVTLSFGGTQVSATVSIINTKFLLVSVAGGIVGFDATTGTPLGTFATGLVNPQQMALGPDGNIYVTDAGCCNGTPNGGVRRYDITGRFIDTFVPMGTAGLSQPIGLAFGSDGNLYVSDSGSVPIGVQTTKILRFDRTGAPVGTGVFASSSDMTSPTQITFGPDGNLYVANGGASSVVRFNGTTGAPMPSVGNTGALFVSTRAGGLFIASGLQFGPDGLLYVTDSVSGRILRFDPLTGAYFDDFAAASGFRPNCVVFGPDGNLYTTNFSAVWRFTVATKSFIDAFVPDGLNAASYLLFVGVAVPIPPPNPSPTTLLVASTVGNQVLRYDENTGAFLGVFTSGGGLSRPYGLAFGGDGNLYVSGEFNNAVLKYDGTTGAFLGTFATAGLQGPRGLTFGPDGSLYVASLGNHQVVKFDNTGTPVATLTPSGAFAPQALTFGPDGNLYVADIGNGTIWRFSGNTGGFIDTFASGGSAIATDLVFGPGGKLYVATGYPDSRVIRYDGITGTFVDTFISHASGGLSGSDGLVFGANNTLYISSSQNNQVLGFSSTTGTFQQGLVPQGSGGLVSPTLIIRTNF